MFEYNSKEHYIIFTLKNIEEKIRDFLLVNPDSKELLSKLFDKIQYFLISKNEYFLFISNELSFEFHRMATVKELSFIEELLTYELICKLPVASRFCVENNNKHDKNIIYIYVCDFN